LPAFAELKLLPNEVPTKFNVMFSQGIDPIVTEPSKCHGHPGVPVQWLTREEIIEYVQHVREDLMEAMDDARISARLINLALEHEYMHLETLAYMLMQEGKKLFEKKSSSNGFNALPHHIVNSNNNNNSHVGTNSGTTMKKKLSAAALKSSIYSSGNNTVPISNGNAVMGGNVAAEFYMVQISNGNVMMGGNVADNGFMRDNEYQQFSTHVSEKFLVSSEPVSVRDFLTFVKEGGMRRRSFRNWWISSSSRTRDTSTQQRGPKCMESIMCILWIQLIIGPKLQISLFCQFVRGRSILSLCGLPHHD
jgi:formylglycine-generating enzyme required for sulfatase activity